MLAWKSFVSLNWNNFLKKNSLDEVGSRRWSLRFHGRLVLFPRRIVAARLSHLHDIGAVTAPLHFDVAGVIRHSAQDAHFRICHLAGVSVRKPIIRFMRLQEKCTVPFPIGTIELFGMAQLGSTSVFECTVSRMCILNSKLPGDGKVLEKGTVVGNYKTCEREGVGVEIMEMAVSYLASKPR